MARENLDSNLYLWDLVQLCCLFVLREKHRSVLPNTGPALDQPAIIWSIRWVPMQAVAIHRFFASFFPLLLFLIILLKE